VQPRVERSRQPIAAGLRLGLRVNAARLLAEVEGRRDTLEQYGRGLQKATRVKKNSVGATSTDFLGGVPPGALNRNKV
jgi:hypothetical protein